MAILAGSDQPVRQGLLSPPRGGILPDDDRQRRPKRRPVRYQSLPAVEDIRGSIEGFMLGHLPGARGARLPGNRSRS